MLLGNYTHTHTHTHTHTRERERESIIYIYIYILKKLIMFLCVIFGILPDFSTKKVQDVYKGRLRTSPVMK